MQIGARQQIMNNDKGRGAGNRAAPFFVKIVASSAPAAGSKGPLCDPMPGYGSVSRVDSPFCRRVCHRRNFS